MPRHSEAAQAARLRERARQSCYARDYEVLGPVRSAHHCPLWWRMLQSVAFAAALQTGPHSFGSNWGRRASFHRYEDERRALRGLLQTFMERCSSLASNDDAANRFRRAASGSSHACTAPAALSFSPRRRWSVFLRRTTMYTSSTSSQGAAGQQRLTRGRCRAASRNSAPSCGWWRMP